MVKHAFLFNQQFFTYIEIFIHQLFNYSYNKNRTLMRWYNIKLLFCFRILNWQQII